MLHEMIKKEKSCGIVVFNDNNVLLVRHNVGHWGIPKGHVEENETEEETAIREVFEETRIRARIIDGFRKVITYSPKEMVIKDVVFFAGVSDDTDYNPQITEISEVKWIKVEDALLLVGHEEEKDVLTNAIAFYKNKIRK